MCRLLLLLCFLSMGGSVGIRGNEGWVGGWNGWMDG